MNVELLLDVGRDRPEPPLEGSGSEWSHDRDSHSLCLGFDHDSGTLARVVGVLKQQVVLDLHHIEGSGPNRDQSSAVQAVVDEYGPSDFTQSYSNSVDAALVLPQFLVGDLGAVVNVVALFVMPDGVAKFLNAPFGGLHRSRDMT